MISKYIIRALYKKYSKPPRNFSELNIDEFVSICGDSYGITVDDVSMTFGQMSAVSYTHLTLPTKLEV